MPQYYVRNKKTGRYVRVVDMTISEMVEYEKDLPPHLEIAAGAPGIGYSFHRMKPNDGWKDRLKEMKRAHPGNTINVP